EGEVDLARADARAEPLAVLLEAPVVDPDAGALGLGVRERHARARRALLVDQAAALRVGERGVREEDLARVEAARVVALVLRPHTEERDLESHRAVEPA